MTSERQIAANRRNAAKSTGPTTAEGKARASRNASRHGLSRQASHASPVDDAIDAIGQFALQLVGEEASPAELELARAAAAAELDLIHIRHRRQKLLDALMTAMAAGDASAAKEMTAASIGRLDRYARRAETRRRTALVRLARRCRLPFFG